MITRKELEALRKERESEERFETAQNKMFAAVTRVLKPTPSKTPPVLSKGSKSPKSK